MSYTVLARRYRSGTFDEVIGQSHVAQTLKKAIETNRVAHAYLFCGTRGVGKTSMARILAKALNCEKSDGPTPEPCGKCNSCVAIARGEDMDVLEIDAASNTGVDNVRDLIANSAYRPARSRFKIYIIDEVHMLSKSAFNALLKTLEEPPGHVKFILATTEPEKVPATILSRCQRFDFHSIPTRQIAGHLKEICRQEKIDADEDALLLVAKAGAGSMRDSLSLLDRLLGAGETHLTAQSIEQLLGLPKTQLLFDLAQAIGEGNVKAVLGQVDSMLAGGMSADTLIASLADHLRNLLILRTCGPDNELVEAPGLSMDQLAKQAEAFDAIVLSQDLTILEELRRHLRQSQAGRALLDATLVRLALAEQFTPMDQLLSRLSGAAPTSVPAKAAAPPVKKKYDVAAPSEISPSPGTLPEGRDEAPPAEVAAAPPRIEPAGDTDLPRVWQAVLERLGENERGLRSLLEHGRFAGIDENRAVIRYSVQHQTFVKMLERNGKKDLVKDALAAVLNKSVGIRFEVDETPLAPPALLAPSADPSSAIPPTAAALPAAVVSKTVSPPAPATAGAAAAGPAHLPLTAEVKDQLRQDPLIAAIMQELGGQIIRLEE